MIDENKLMETLSKNSIFKIVANSEGKTVFDIINEQHHMPIMQIIGNCFMTQMYEYPGIEEGMCAGLRTLNGDGEPCVTCEMCSLYYGNANEVQDD